MDTFEDFLKVPDKESLFQILMMLMLHTSRVLEGERGQSTDHSYRKVTSHKKIIIIIKKKS